MLSDFFSIREIVLLSGLVGLLGFLVGQKIGIRTAKKQFSVTVSPFYRSSSKSILPWKDELIEIGYSYQLCVGGLPCLFPYERIEIHKRTAELDQDKLIQLVDNFARNSIALSNPAGCLAIHFSRPVERNKIKG